MLKNFVIAAGLVSIAIPAAAHSVSQAQPVAASEHKKLKKPEKKDEAKDEENGKETEGEKDKKD